MNIVIMKQLINLANRLDSIGMTKEADYLDEIINDPDTIEEFGDFRDLNDTNIDPEGAFEVGFMLGDEKSTINKAAFDGASRMVPGGGGEETEAAKQRYSKQEYYLKENERLNKLNRGKRRWIFDQDAQQWKFQTLTDMQILDEASQKARRRRRYGKENPSLDEMIAKDMENLPEVAKEMKDSGSKKVHDFRKWLKRTGKIKGAEFRGYLVSLNPKYLMNALDDYKLGLDPAREDRDQEFI